MPVIIFPPANYDTGSSSSVEGHTHSNFATLNKLSTNAAGKLCFNGQVVGENAIETALNVTLTDTYIQRKFISLPDDCYTSRSITLTLNGVGFSQGDFWEVRENVNSSEADLIAWNGLSLENFAQSGDKLFITYYKKI